MLVKYKTTLCSSKIITVEFALCPGLCSFQEMAELLKLCVRKMLGNVKLIAHLLRLRCLAAV